MLVKCRECGEMISNLARVCPHCGCPAESRLSCMKVGGLLKRLSTRTCSICTRGIKCVLPHFRIRVPWTLIVPSFLAIGLFTVLTVECTVYESERSRFDDGYFFVFLWSLWLLFSAVNFAIIRGSRVARIWLVVGMGILLLTRVSNPLAFSIVALIEVPWIGALFSRSAQRWFAAHKRLDERRRRAVLHEESKA